MDYSTYQSPFTWRYGSNEMRYIFSEIHKYELWRKIWIALAEVQHSVGLVSKKELADLKANEKDIDIDRILEIEKEVKHDVVAAIKEYAEKAKIGGGKIHLGATSYDIVDNADALRAKEALVIIENRLKVILSLLSGKIEQYADFPCIGYTHLQPAEPTTVGYRLAFYAQELLIQYEYLQFVKRTIKGKGFKGAVGTAASYSTLLKGTDMAPDEMEKKIMEKLGIEASIITSQIYTKHYDYLTLNALSGISAALEKFAVDLRILQSPMFGEWSEPFGKKQVGSSAMPFKKNPVNSEKLCSLARYVTNLPKIVLENSMHSYLDRTLDDSANRRSTVPDAFLATDEVLITARKLIEGLIINETRITHNLKQFAPFAASEGILMEAVKNGANRQDMHELLREIAMQAWPKVQLGEENPMEKLLIENNNIGQYLPAAKLKKLLDVSTHIGTAPKRARQMAKKIKSIK